MSHPSTENWLENAAENFQEALSTENWAFCRAIIADVRDQSPSAANVMEKLLVEAQNK